MTEHHRPTIPCMDCGCVLGTNTNRCGPCRVEDEQRRRAEEWEWSR